MDAFSGYGSIGASNIKFKNNDMGAFGVLQAYGTTLQLTFVNEVGVNTYCTYLNSTRKVQDPPPPPAPTFAPTSASTCRLMMNKPDNKGLNFLLFGDWGTGKQRRILIFARPLLRSVSSPP